MKCSEVIQKLSELAPETLACDWDNPGLLVGRRDKSVSRILVALDVTEETVDYAVRAKADLIVSHHPLIFSGLKKINSDDVFGRRLLKLIRSDITVFAMHTNFDKASGGMGDLAAARLELSDCEVLEDAVTYTDAAGRIVQGGIGRIGTLPSPMRVEAFCQLVRERFDREHVTLFGRPDPACLISRIAVCPGSGKSGIGRAVDLGADLYLSGDIGHHDGLDAWEQGLPIVDAGHYGLEHIFVEAVETYLSDCTTADVEILTMTDAEPFRVL